jgi:hypothetical protein
MNMQDNLRHSRHAEITRGGYRRYDNYDAIDVPFTDAIPDDCMEMMGVPISFLDKHNPEQFEIVGITKTWFGAATKTYGPQVQVDADGTKTTVSKLNDGAAIRVAEAPIGKTYYMAEGALFIQSYPRILIKRRPPA